MSIIMDLFVRSHEQRKSLTDEEFWELIRTMEHKEGKKTAAPIIQHLKKHDDEYIFAFDDKLFGLVCALDGKKWADELFGGDAFSEEKFLAARYSAVAAGMEYYSKIIGHRERLSDANICEIDGKWRDTAGLMTAAAKAWSEKHEESEDKYPHSQDLKFDLKSHSNKEMWQ